MDETKGESNNVQQSPEKSECNMSKTQLKKLRKRMKWLETKRERRLAEKQKKKQRRAERIENGEDLGPSRKNLKLNTMRNSSCKIRVALDLSLEEYMSEKDIASLTLQIQYSYSSNRRAANPMQLYACGLGGRTQQRLDSIGDYKSWDIHFKEESYLEAFPKESIVYLSSESSNVLTSLSEDKVYVIGGLVDHNAHKGLCHRLAEENEISHAQLPIAEFLHLKGRKVLAVNHVFAILLRFTESGDWKEAFLSELPKRRGLTSLGDEGLQQTTSADSKGKNDSDNNEEDDDDDGEVEEEQEEVEESEESSLQTTCDNVSATTTTTKPATATTTTDSSEARDNIENTETESESPNVKTYQQEEGVIATEVEESVKDGGGDGEKIEELRVAQ